MNAFESRSIRRSFNFTVVGRVGVLAVVPIAVGFVVSRMLADPFFALAQKYNPEVFTLTDREKVEGAHEVRKHVLRLRMDAAIGRAPPLVDEELQVRSQALVYTYYPQFLAPGGVGGCAIKYRIQFSAGLQGHMYFCDIPDACERLRVLVCAGLPFLPICVRTMNHQHTIVGVA